MEEATFCCYSPHLPKRKVQSDHQVAHSDLFPASHLGQGSLSTTTLHTVPSIGPPPDLTDSPRE